VKWFSHALGYDVVMQKCISQWSIRGGDGSRDPAELMDEAKAVGFDGIELAIGPSGFLTPLSSESECQKIRELASQRSLALQTLASGMSWANSPTHRDADVRKRGVALHHDALLRAKWLGCQAMLFVPGAVKIPWDSNYLPVPYDQAMIWAKDAIQRLAEVAERVGVDVAVENVWNGLFYSPLEFAQLIDDIGSSRVGIYFDVGNVLGLHQHPPDWVRILGPRIKRIHIKDFKTSVGNLSGFCDLLAGDVPWPETMSALREIGYDKTVVAEMMPPDETLLTRTKAAMDQIWEM